MALQSVVVSSPRALLWRDRVISYERGKGQENKNKERHDTGNSSFKGKKAARRRVGGKRQRREKWIRPNDKARRDRTWDQDLGERDERVRGRKGKARRLANEKAASWDFAGRKGVALWFAIAIQAGKQGVGRGSRSGREPLYRDKTAALAVSDVYRAAPPSPSPKSQGHRSGTASRERCELRASNGPGPAQGIDGWARLALGSTALLGFPQAYETKYCVGSILQLMSCAPGVGAIISCRGGHGGLDFVLRTDPTLVSSGQNDWLGSRKLSRRAMGLDRDRR